MNPVDGIGGDKEVLAGEETFVPGYDLMKCSWRFHGSCVNQGKV